MQHEDHDQPEDDHLEIAGLAEQLRQQVLQPLLEDGDQAGAKQGAPHVPDTADHRHEQVFDTLRERERRRIHEALQMRIEPAGDTGELGGDGEDDDLVPGGVDTHRLGHHDAALERADGAAVARIEQVLRRHHAKHQGDPDQVVELAAALQFHAEQAHRRDAAEPGMAAEGLDVAEQEI